MITDRLSHWVSRAMLVWFALISLVAAATPANSEPGDLVKFLSVATKEEALASGVVGMHSLRFSRVKIDPGQLLLYRSESSLSSGPWMHSGGLHTIEPF